MGSDRVERAAQGGMAMKRREFIAALGGAAAKALDLDEPLSLQMRIVKAIE
jgi:hypothetical protein